MKSRKNDYFEYDNNMTYNCIINKTILPVYYKYTKYYRKYINIIFIFFWKNQNENKHIKTFIRNLNVTHNSNRNTLHISLTIYKWNKN